MSNSMSFSTVRGAAGVLPTPSSCAHTNINFQSGSNTAGCVFTPHGSDIKPYQDCCDNAPVLTFSDGCGFYCDAKGQSLGELSNCLKKRSNNVSCQSNSGNGSGNSVSQSSSSSSSSDGDGGDSNIGNTFSGDGSSGSSSSSSSSGNDNNDDSSDDNNNDNSDWGSDFPLGSAAYTTHFATSTATHRGGSPESDNSDGGVVASTEAVAGPGQTANAATSVGPNGASGTGATTSDFFGTAGTSGAPRPSGNSTTGSPSSFTPTQPAATSFTGAAVAVPVPGAGVSKGGLFAVAVLVLGVMTGAVL